MSKILSKLKTIIFPYVSQKKYDEIKLQNYALRKKLTKQALRCQFLETQNKDQKYSESLDFEGNRIVHVTEPCGSYDYDGNELYWTLDFYQESKFRKEIDSINQKLALAIEQRNYAIRNDDHGFAEEHIKELDEELENGKIKRP